MQLPQEFITRRSIDAIQHFGQSLLETIPADEMIVVEGFSSYGRMLDVIWKDKRYLIFQRDLAERTERLKQRSDEDLADEMFA